MYRRFISLSGQSLDLDIMARMFVVLVVSSIVMSCSMILRQSFGGQAADG